MEQELPTLPEHQFFSGVRVTRSSAGCQVILYFRDFAIFPICLKFPILHPKILYFSKTIKKKVESLVLSENFI